MKGIILVALAFIVSTLSLAVFAQAATGASSVPAMTTGASPTGAAMKGGKHPCHNIEEACKSAGFVRGGATAGKGIMEDCMKPILAGNSVTGVTVDQADVVACIAKRNAMKKPAAK